jgi:hypothetical protein
MDPWTMDKLRLVWDCNGLHIAGSFDTTSTDQRVGISMDQCG